ncbi:hypothetical protein HK097_009506 [Rhizophlyctis rosea]|uniref:Uncharacterized protein n=1 Tax=Rhizophlyctis rosea TaxID=64517 RepID=A0AAD5S8U7_9FUNG|nr:hypothetical protein HK097_009506 [Rhizophlyctis rosea]
MSGDEFAFLGTRDLNSSECEPMSEEASIDLEINLTQLKPSEKTTNKKQDAHPKPLPQIGAVPLPTQILFQIQEYQTKRSQRMSSYYTKILVQLKRSLDAWGPEDSFIAKAHVENIDFLEADEWEAIRTAVKTAYVENGWKFVETEGEGGVGWKAWGKKGRELELYLKRPGDVRMAKELFLEGFRKEVTGEEGD